MDELRKLPESMQRVVLVRSQMHKQQDVADVLGISRSRVNHVLATVSLRVNELAEQRNVGPPVASPRAARLRELEDEPPEWLRKAIGRPVPQPQQWRRAPGVAPGGPGDRRLSPRVRLVCGKRRARSAPGELAWRSRA